MNTFFKDFTLNGPNKTINKQYANPDIIDSKLSIYCSNLDVPSEITNVCSFDNNYMHISYSNNNTFIDNDTYIATLILRTYTDKNNFTTYNIRIPYNINNFLSRCKLDNKLLTINCFGLSTLLTFTNNNIDNQPIIFNNVKIEFNLNEKCSKKLSKFMNDMSNYS